MILTILSDTHNKHKHITGDLPGGDLLIHAGDISSMGYEHEIREFAKWFNGLDNYTSKVFISGNHDWGFQNNAEKIKGILTGYKNIDYLEDDFMGIIEGGGPEIKIWGSPWQPEFYNWAFNLPRNGEELKSKWDMIPEDTDILITHGPAWGILDDVEGRRGYHLGCELLAERIKQIKPKIHICGHIHSGRNIVKVGDTLHINASVLDERYNYAYRPITIDFNFKTNEWDLITF